MKGLLNRTPIKFVVTTTIYHLITYFIFGFIASSVFNYKQFFELPIIQDYYKAFGSVSNLLGPLIQIVRGLLFGLVLLPFVGFLKETKFGWLYLWFLFVGIGIIGTPAAAPASIEGLIYTKIPLWFHLIGLPEILCQTLVFSILVHRGVRAESHPLSLKVRTVIKALSMACFSFIGYTVISIGFALVLKAEISQSSSNFMVLGQFIMPLVITFAISLLGKSESWIVNNIVLYVLSALALFFYQSIVLHGANIVYILIAPILPTLIYLIIARPKRPMNE